MVKFINQLLSLNNLRKIFNFSQLISLTKKGFEFQIFQKIPAKNILVLSPHPDDDVLGLGGTIALSTKAKVKITCLIIFQGNSGTETGQKKSELKTIRKKEVLSSAKILKISKLIFWNIEDGNLKIKPKVIEKLKKIIEKTKPEIIFFPSLFDNHPDHFAINQLFYNFLKKYPFLGQIWGYEVWTPTYINRLIPITSVMKTKVRAIKKHASQLKCRDYLGAIEGLNSYRGKIFIGKGFAEGFLVLNQETYLKIFKKFL